jgi:type IV secretion system protein VirB6
MGFFATFSRWLDSALNAYISHYTQRVADVLAPAVVVCGTIYVILWGYMHLTGRVDEPFGTGLKRIIMLAVVFGVGLHLWLYNDLITDTFYQAPSQFASAVITPPPATPFNTVNAVDQIWTEGSTVAQTLGSRVHWNGGWDFLVWDFAVRIIVGALCVYTMFLLALSKVALAILIALGPLFIGLLFFESTSRFFNGWITQLANYALITILTVMVAALFLQLVQKYAADTANLGVLVRTADALDMLLVCVLATLFMMQIPPLAASLAGGGTGLNTFGLERGVGKYVGGKAYGVGAAATVGTAGFVAGLFSSSSSPKPREWSRSRKAGYATKTKVARMMSSRNKIERVG